MVPEGWIPTTLEHIAEPRTGLQTGPFGSQLKASEYADEGIPVIMPKDIRDGRVVDDTAARVSESTAASLHKHRCEVGDILFGRRGDIGRCAVITSKERGWLCGTGCLRARPRAGTVDADFLTQQLRQQSIAAWLTEHAVGQTMLNLNTSILGALPLLLPPLPEQRKIAAILSSVDEAIEKTQAVIDQVQVVKKGLMQELLTRGLPGRHAKFKQTEIGEIPEEWELSNVGRLFGIQLGKMLNETARVSSSQFPYLANRNVQWGRLELGDLSMMGFDESERDKFSLRPGDLLVCEGGEVGRTAVWRGERANCYYQKAVHRLRPSDSRITPEFMLHFMRQAADRGLFVHLTGRSSIAHLTKEKLSLLCVPLPPTHEQQCISDVLGSLDLRIAAETSKGAALVAVKQALMSVLLTGEVRVKVDPEPTP